MLAAILQSYSPSQKPVAFGKKQQFLYIATLICSLVVCNIVLTKIKAHTATMKLAGQVTWILGG